MKRLVFFLTITLSVISCSEDNAPRYEDLRIVVKDRDTKEAIKGVSLTLVSLFGKDKKEFKNSTDENGEYCFLKLEAGKYSIKLEETNYEPKEDVVEQITNNEDVYTFQLTRKPASLNLEPTVLADTINFGENSNTEQFRFVNPHQNTITWHIYHSCSWIKSVKSHSNEQDYGALAPGKTETVTVIIDRTKLLQTSVNVDNISVGTSEEGGAKVAIVAVNKSEAPIVITNEATQVTTTSATLNGTITYEGKPSYSERGFCYSTNENPTISNNKREVAGSGTGSYSLNITDLNLQTTYYVRTYVIQNGIVIYGNAVNFSTLWQSPILTTSAATNIDTNSATLNATITAEGIPAYTERGFCYSGTTSNPTVNDTKITINGSGIGNYSTNITGLEQEKTYYVKAYARQGNTVVYGNTIDFKTAGVLQTVVQTSAATNIGTNAATLNATITVEGAPSYTERGFCYSGTTSNPTVNDTKITVNGSGTGNYSTNITGLEQEKTYYVKAYARQGNTVVYGNTINFTTVWINAILTTSAVTNIGATSATFNAAITNAGTPEYTERGFCYAKGSYSYPDITDRKIIVSGSGTGNYSTAVSGLEQETTYCVRSYARQGNEVAYGNIVTFSTIYVETQVSTLAESSIQLGLFTMNGRIDAVGEPPYFERGFCYTSVGIEDEYYYTPTIANNRTIVTGTGAGNFSYKLTKVPELKVYIYRAYAKQGMDVIYGDEIEVISGSKPIVTTGPVKNVSYSNGIMSGSATLQGYVNFTGWPKYTEKGFVYSAGYTAPTISAGEKITVSGLSNTGLYTANITSLIRYQTYYARAYVTNSLGTSYGDIITFNIE